ncbi:MAG: GGDEF domain-containing protein [Halieaceae bacterium]|jgi:two-component system, cell cycle response regulator|nr:GGDEF domain-containing protein [Halieaceae bacterium]
MANVPRLLDQIMDLTAQRYIELLEFSLLQTLNSAVEPSQLKLLTLDEQLEPVTEIKPRKNRFKVSKRKIKTEAEVLDAIKEMSGSEVTEQSIPFKEGVILLQCLKSGELTSTYLIMQFDDQISDAQAHLVSSLVQINSTFYRLLEDSQIDQLTGLANRKTFDDTITKIHELVYPDSSDHSDNKRSEHPYKYWLVMVGIDQLNGIINNLGHLYGDEVLLQVAQIIMDCFRENDMIFRFGGEEFVIILRSKCHESCEVALARFRDLTAAHSFPEVGDITVSTGAAEILRDTSHVSLMEYSAKALHHNKDEQTGRITFYDELVGGTEMEG